MLKRNLIPVVSIGLLLVGLAAVNVLAALWPMHLDVTQDRLFTLTDGTRRILGGLKDPVTVKLYVPDSVPDAPVTVKTEGLVPEKLVDCLFGSELPGIECHCAGRACIHAPAAAVAPPMIDTNIVV